MVLGIRRSAVSKAEAGTAAKRAAKRFTVETFAGPGRITQEQLRKKTEEKAYELFARRGYVHGNDALDWTLAQKLVVLENQAAAAGKFRRTVNPEAIRGEIERKAYELFEHRGYTNGNDQFDWSLAEEMAILERSIR